MLLVAQVNDCHMRGLSHAEAATALRDLPQRVRLVCSRRKSSADDKLLFSSSTSTDPRLVRAKSEQSLASTSESASLSRSRSKSLEPVSKFGIWSSEPTEVQLVKGDGGLGFSILDDPVSNGDFVCMLTDIIHIPISAQVSADKQTQNLQQPVKALPLTERLHCVCL